MKRVSVRHSDLNISLLREYIVLAQVRSFTQAAKILNTTQAVLSKHVAQLERAVGQQLVRRSTSPIEPSSLTAAGESLLDSAFQIVNSYDNAFNKTSQKIAVSLGGHYHHATVALATQVIEHHQRAGNEFYLRLNKYAAISTEDMIRRDRSDVLVVMPDDRLDMQGMATRPLFKDRVMACLPRGHRLCQHDHLCIEDFKDETLIVAQGYAQYDNWSYIRRMCENRGFTPRARFMHIETNDDFLCTATFEAVYFIPAYTLQYHVMLQKPVFDCRLLVDEDCFFEYRVAYRPDTCNPETENFVNELLSIPLESLVTQGKPLSLFR